MNFLLETVIIIIYLLFLVGMGLGFRHFNANLDDYIRGGAQGTWWLVGASILMSGISAFTFTGNAGASYQAGFTPIIIYVAQVIAYLVAALFLAPWFRQTRVLTPPEIFRIRYGVEVEQFISYFSFLTSIVTSSLWLWGVATFCSTVFDIPVHFTILAIGAVTLAYATMGGRWGVLATDFIQSLVMFSITLLLAWLALKEVGGVSGLVEAMQQPAVADDFALIKDPEQYPAGKYALNWIVATFLIIFMQGIGFNNASKYLSVKDGREARKAALLAAFLMGVGGLIWFIPPIVARIRFSELVAASPVSNPHEASYAVIAQELLPNGMMGIMVVAMFSATMSSLDTGLNASAGIFMRNMLPPIRRLFKLPEMPHARQVWTGKLVTTLLGCAIIGMALFLAQREDLSLFDAFFLMTTIIGLPAAVPAIVAVFVRPLPRWSYFFSTGCGMLVSAYSVLQEFGPGESWSVQERIFWVFGAGIVSTLVTIPFYYSNRWTSPAFRERVDAFYREMHTPVDFEKEIRVSKDYTQMHLISLFSICIGVFITLLTLVPNTWEARIQILFVGGFSVCVGIFLRLAARRIKKRESLKSPEAPE